MLGQGLLRACLAATEVSGVTTIGRTPTGLQHPKLRDITAPDLTALGDELLRGRTENALFRLPFKCVCAIRPGLIQPLHGARSKTGSYRVFYQLFGPLMPLARWLAPAPC